MTRLIKFTVITILFSFIISSFSFAQQKDSPEELSKRVKELEKYRQLLERTHELDLKELNSNFNNKSKELDLELKDCKIEIKDSKNKINLFIAALIFLGLGSASAIYGIYKHFSKKVKEIGEGQMEKKFDQLFEEKKKLILEMIENHDLEFQLKTKKNIVILSPNGSDDLYLRDFFYKMNFSNYNFRTVVKHEALEDVDLILFNDNGGKRFEEELIQNYIRKTKKDTIIFYFGPKENNIKFDERCAMANVIPQLYGNLINALRYQLLLK